MQLQIKKNALTVPAPEFEEGWFLTISNGSKVISKINLFVENNTTKNASKNGFITH